MKRNLKIGLILIALFIGVSSLFIDVFLESIVEAKLESAIQLQENRIYDYKFEKVKTRLLMGDLTLKGLHIQPRTRVIDSLREQGILKKDIYEIKLDQFRLSGLDSWRLIMNDEIDISTIYLQSPQVKVYSNKKVPTGPNKKLFGEILSPNLPWAYVDSFVIENAHFEIFRIEEDTTLDVSFDTLNLSMYSFHTDSGLIASGMYFTYSGLGITIKNVRIHSLPELDIDLEKLRFNPDKNYIRLTGVEVKPKLSKYEYMKTKKYETDWIRIHLDELYLKDIDFDKLHERGIITMSSVNIDSPKISVYRDKRMPDKPYKFVALPSRLIRNIEFPFHIDSLTIDNAEVTYLEWANHAKEPGKLTLDKLNAKIYNLGSEPDYLEKDDVLELKANGRLMKNGSLKFEMKASILDTNDLFITSGEVRDMEINAMNPLLEHIAFVKFEAGKLNFMTFNMSADNTRSTGRLDIDFTDFKKMTLVRNKEEFEEKMKGKDKKDKSNKKFLSFLANTYLPNNYGPGSIDYYQGRIHFDRLQNKFIFNYLLKSIQSGVQSSVLPSFEEDWQDMRKEKQARVKEEKAEKRMKKKKNK